VGGREYYGLEQTNPAAAKMAKLMGQSLSTRPAAILHQMAKEKLATRSGEYVYVATAFGDNVFILVYRAYVPFTEEDARVFRPELQGDDHKDERDALSHWLPGERDVRSDDDYRLVICNRIPIEPGMNVANMLADYQTQEHAEKYIELARGRALEGPTRQAANELTQWLHAVPFGAVADWAANGEASGLTAGDAAFSLAADVALSAVPAGKALQLSARAMRVVRITAIGTNLALGATRGTQAVLAFQSTDQNEKNKAHGYLGEAFLRLLGASAETVAELKVLAAEAKAANAGSKLSNAGGKVRAGAAAVEEITDEEVINAVKSIPKHTGGIPKPSRLDLADFVKHAKGELPDLPGSDFVKNEGTTPVTGAGGWTDAAGREHTQVFVSGVNNAEGSGTLAPYSGRDAVAGVTALNQSHVEVQMAYKMRTGGLKQGELWVNDPAGPCGLSTAKVRGCTPENLEEILPSGSNLNIFWRDADRVIQCMPLKGMGR
jgi:hypothetical protein